MRKEYKLIKGSTKEDEKRKVTGLEKKEYKLIKGGTIKGMKGQRDK